MKRIFTLCMMALLTATIANAQGYRKWDFTNWSAQTVANLQAEAEAGVTGKWSDIEKSDGTNPQPNNCYWSNSANTNDEGNLTANGVVIAETEGLVWNTSYTAKRSLAIAVNYPSTSLGEYAGPQYLWLGGGNAKSASARITCFTIPKVAVGQRISITAESHKPSDKRGVSLYAGNSTNDALLIGESFTPTTQDTHVWEEGWTLPEGATANADGTIDIQVYNTNGCHIYTIEVGNSDQKSKVAYLYNGSTDAEPAFAILGSSDKYTLEPLEANAAFTLDALTAYDAVIIGASVSNADAIASLKAIQPFVPMLNLNTAIYAAWGYGSVQTVENPFADVKQVNHALFRGLEVITEEGVSGLVLTTGSSISAVTLDGLFANDAVLATAMSTDLTAIHAHNLSHNGFIYIPAFDAAPQILANAISLLLASKAKVTAAPKPTIKLEYKNQNTNVVLSSAVTGAEIFYTIDGSVPTEQSTVYTEPFNIATEGVTVKAVARGDGYLLSEVAEQLVDLKDQMATPTISVEQADGASTVTIAGEGTIWYNYSNTNDTLKSSKYTQPIILTMPRTVYAFATDEVKVASELASQEVTINNAKVRIDVLAHMDANSTEYNNGSTSTAYYFSWLRDKNAHPYYNTEAYTTEMVVNENGDEVEKKTYTELSDEEEKDFENGWAIRSRGQLVIWENIQTGENIGDHSGYNYATVDDINPYFPVTRAYINLADKNTSPSDGQGFPYNAYIVTTKKFAGPFDVVANVGSIVKPAEGTVTKHDFVIEISADGNAWESSWQVLGDTIKMEGLNRLTKNITRSYEGTDEVYVRAYLTNNNSKIGFYDIYIANEGEKSKELANGISETTTAATKAVKGIYTINGLRRQQMQRGLNIVVASDGSVKKVMVK